MSSDSTGRAGSAQVAITAFFALFSVVGLALYGLPLYYDFMVREFGWSRTMVTSGNAVSKLVVGPLFGFGAGWIVDRFGPRRLMMAGILMAGIALVGLGAISSLWMFYLFYLLNALGYVSGGPLPNQVLLSRWFDRTRGKAMGFAYLGIGFGGALVPILANFLTGRFGWRGSLQTLGVLVVVIALPLAYFVKEGPAVGPKAEAPAADPGRDRRSLPSVRGVLRSPAFYLLAIGSMCSIAAVGGTNQHLKLFLSLDRAYSQGDAARVISLVLAFSIAGRLLMGWLADRMPKKFVMLLIYLLVASSVPLLLVGSSEAPVYLFAVVFGIALGGEYMIIPLMAGELFGVNVLGRVLGIVLTADGVAEATAPMLVGFLRDRTGAYNAGFFTLIGAALAGAVAIGLLPSRPIAGSDVTLAPRLATD
ncbi:MAG TPA: MFS transporter [Vicinamibacterales bacterium]|nr:MFS transporter [Vicinamibacterales bacterium]